MKNRFMILPFGVLFFALIAIGLSIYDHNVCDPFWKTTEDNLNNIKNPNSIREIKLIPAYPNKSVNLVNDTIIISDSSIIENIRIYICNRKYGSWNHPISAWDVKLSIIMINSKTFDIVVSKISNDGNMDMTHIYFGTDHCYDDKPNFSLKLGKYLESLTNNYRIR